MGYFSQLHHMLEEEKKQHDEPSDEEICFVMSEQELQRSKYLCIGNAKVKAQWLPRWYGVPHTECAFTNESEPATALHPDAIKQSNIIKLPVLPKGSDYKQKLKEIRTEHLIYGNDIR